MQIVQATCCIDTELEPLLPRKRMIVGVVQVITEGPKGHIIINENHLIAIVTIFNQRNEMDVAKLGEHLDLGLKLVGPLLGTRFQPLDRNWISPTIDVSFVHVTKPPTPIINTSSKLVAALISANEKLRHRADRRDDLWVFVDLVIEKENGPHQVVPSLKPESLTLLRCRKIKNPIIDSTTKPETPPPTTETIVVLLLFDFVGCTTVGGTNGSGSGLNPTRLPLLSLTLKISTPFKIAST